MGRISVDLPPVGELSTIAAENNPNRLAFIDDTGASVTWSEFEERSKVAADAFADHVRQGDRVAFLSESSVDTTVLWNGALKAGAIVSYVHTRASADTVRYSIDKLRPEVLVVGEDFADFLADQVWDSLEAQPKVIVVGNGSRDYECSSDTFVDGSIPQSPDVIHEEDDIAAIVWTSGTTGKPKGWCHTHRSIVLKSVIWDVDRTTTHLSSASPSFMSWYGNVVPIMVAGGTIVYLPEWDPARWAELVEEHRVTRAGMVPTMWRAVLDLDLEEYDLSTLESISFVGEKMDRRTLTRLREQICPEVTNLYASTEHVIARIKAEEMEGDRIESVGKPFDTTKVRIIEPDGDPDDVRPPGEPGEIVVKAPDCPVWAWGRSDKAAEQYRDGWWYSGDMGYKDEDGYLFLEGRKDFMIKSKGVKVHPAPIENHLNDHPDVDEAVVFGVDDEEYGQRVSALVRRSDTGLTADELDRWCLDADPIARFERPRDYFFTDEQIPRTPSQKLDRKTVRELVEAGRFDSS